MKYPVAPSLRKFVVRLMGIGLAFSAARLTIATPPGISLLETFDLSPGADAYFPFQLGLNHNTHKLYIPGSTIADGSFTASEGSSGFGVKVIDTTSNTVVAGIALGYYDAGSGSMPAFKPIAIAVDESPAPAGNKIYVLGHVGDEQLFLRTIDGATDTNETDQGTDVLLPVTSLDDRYVGMTVNAANHKVYASNENGEVVVIDGPGRQVLTTLPLLDPYSTHVLVANPVANKVFFFGSQETDVIDSNDDSFTSFNTDYSVQDAIFDPVSGRIFVAAEDSSLDPELVAVDGVTGATIASTSAVPDRSRGITADGLSSRVYIGGPSESISGIIPGQIASFSATDLSAKGTFDIGASKLSFDGGGASARIYLIDNDYSLQAPAFRNSVGILDPATAEVTKVTVGYSPGQIAINPKTNRVYIVDLKAPEAVVLDGATHAILARVPIPPRETRAPYEDSPGFRPIAVSIAMNRFYVTHSVEDPATGDITASIDEYDGESNDLLATITVNTDSSAVWPQITVDDTRRRLYAYGRMTEPTFGSFIKVYDLIDDTDITTITSGIFAINDMIVNPVTGLVYLAGSSFTPLTIIDPATNLVIGTVTVGILSGTMAVNVQTNRIFIVDQAGNAVTVIDGNAGEKETTISNATQEPGGVVRSVAVDEITNTVFLGGYSSQPSGSVSLFDANNDYASLGQIDVGRYPERMAFNTATRQLFVSNDQDGTISVLESSTPAPPDRFANISTRLGVETDDNVLIGGFIITGPAGSTKQVVIRGIGPSLTAQGVSGALADPIIELHSGALTIATNDNWKINENGESQQAAIEATTIPPTNDLESAILATMTPGNYTAVMRGSSGGTGVGLVEVYDLTESATTKMVNISTRGRVEIGDNVMIGGVIVTGANPSRVLLRAIGPSLTDAGVAGALQDPVLELHDGQGALITTNGNWRDDDESEIIATGIPPTDDRESALIATLYPANYTAIVRGTDDGVGVGLVEAYYLP